MTTDVKALIDRMRFQLQREGLKSAVRGALSDGADALTALSAENEALRADLTAGRELMRQVWDIFNALRARSGAPDGWDHGYWNDLTESLEALLGDDAKPWMTAAATELLKSVERERAEAVDALAALEAENEALINQRDLHAYACDSAEAEVDLLKVQRDEAERLYNAKCGELHQALVARDRAQEPVRTAADQLEGMATALRNLNPDRPCIEADGLELYARGIRAALSPEPPAALSNPSETPNGSAAPSPVTDEMAEVLREALHDRGNRGVSLVAARAALTAALGRKP